MSADDVRTAQAVAALLAGRDIVPVLSDQEEMDRLRAELEPLVKPDFGTAMVGPEYTPQRLEAHGVEGFRDAWLDWTSAFATFQIDIEEVIDGPEAVVSMARQTATTKTGGVEVVTSAASVMTFRDGRVSRMEFHLDREAARRAAGLQP